MKSRLIPEVGNDANCNYKMKLNNDTAGTYCKTAAFAI